MNYQLLHFNVLPQRALSCLQYGNLAKKNNEDCWCVFPSIYQTGSNVCHKPVSQGTPEGLTNTWNNYYHAIRTHVMQTLYTTPLKRVNCDNRLSFMI